MSKYYALNAQILGHKQKNGEIVILRRGYEVYIGKLNQMEVDFIAINESYTEYYQVVLTVREASTLQRELTPLESIHDHNLKYLLTLDDDSPCSHNG